MLLIKLYETCNCFHLSLRRFYDGKIYIFTDTFSRETYNKYKNHLQNARLIIISKKKQTP